MLHITNNDGTVDPDDGREGMIIQKVLRYSATASDRDHSARAKVANPDVSVIADDIVDTGNTVKRYNWASSYMKFT